MHYIMKFTNLLILFGIRKNSYSSGRNVLLYLFIKGVINLPLVIIEEYHCNQLHTQFIQYCLKVTPYVYEIIGVHYCRFQCN
jgi:hypothetical protein